MTTAAVLERMGLGATGLGATGGGSVARRGGSAAHVGTGARDGGRVAHGGGTIHGRGHGCGHGCGPADASLGRVRSRGASLQRGRGRLDGRAGQDRGRGRRPSGRQSLPGGCGQGPSLAEHGVVRWRRADRARVVAARFGAALAERSIGEARRIRRHSAGSPSGASCLDRGTSHDAQAQAPFRPASPISRPPAPPGATRGKPLEAWRQDAAQIGQQGTLTRVWAGRGSRPPAPPDRRRSRACSSGAVRPTRGTGAGLVPPCANAAMTNPHVEPRRCNQARVAPGFAGPGRDRLPGRAGRSRRPGDRRRRLAPDRRSPACAGQRRPAALAALRPRTEPGPTSRPAGPRSRASGPTRAATSRATACSMAAMPSWTPAATPGTGS